MTRSSLGVCGAHRGEDGKTVGGMIFFEHAEELALEDNPLGA
jgi:hypothetical protein